MSFGPITFVDTLLTNQAIVWFVHISWIKWVRSSVISQSLSWCVSRLARSCASMSDWWSWLTLCSRCKRVFDWYEGNGTVIPPYDPKEKDTPLEVFHDTEVEKNVLHFVVYILWLKQRPDSFEKCFEVRRATFWSVKTVHVQRLAWYRDPVTPGSLGGLTWFAKANKISREAPTRSCNGIWFTRCTNPDIDGSPLCPWWCMG